MTKREMQGVLREQLEDKDLVVKMMAIQDTLYPDYSECRLFIEGGDIYSAMFVNEEKVTEFVLCPKENK